MSMFPFLHICRLTVHVLAMCEQRPAVASCTPWAGNVVPCYQVLTSLHTLTSGDVNQNGARKCSV